MPAATPATALHTALHAALHKLLLLATSPEILLASSQKDSKTCMACSVACQHPSEASCLLLQSSCATMPSRWCCWSFPCGILTLPTGLVLMLLSSSTLPCW